MQDLFSSWLCKFSYSHFSFLCRLIPSLLFNYVMMAGVESGYGIAFSRVMGTMKLSDLNVLGPIFYYTSSFFPLLIILVALMTLFNVVNRIITALGLASYLNVFQYSEEPDEDILEAREKLARERKKRGQEAAREDKKENSAERLKQYLIKGKKKSPNDHSDELGGYGSL
jgi:hypothetical protein